MGPPPGGAPNPMGPPPGGAPSPMGPPPGAPMQPMPHQGTEQVKPLSPPPYLASQTAARMDAPQEPWEGTLRMVMIVFGLVLVAGFAAPWALGGDKTIFGWTGLGDMDTFTKVRRIMFAGTGVLSILLGVLPLASLGRGVAAALIGLAPVLYGKFGGGHIDKMGLLVALGTLPLVAGLIVRSQYKSSMAARIMVTIGALAVIAFYLVPQKGFGDKGMLIAVFENFGDADGKGKVSALIGLLPFFLGVASLIAWIPAPSSAGAIVLAWIWIAVPLIFAVSMLLLGDNIGDNLKAGLGRVLWQPGAAMAWTALIGYGIATVVGKQLEHA